jgi:plasmid maintenance system antidote protein VapI
MKPVDPLATLRAFVATHPTQQSAAAALEMSPAYLSDLLNERRDFSAAVLARLGLTQIVVKASKPIGR